MHHLGALPEAGNIAADCAGIGVKSLPEAHGDGVLQLCAADPQDAVKRGGFFQQRVGQ